MALYFQCQLKFIGEENQGGHEDQCLLASSNFVKIIQ